MYILKGISDRNSIGFLVLLLFVAFLSGTSHAQQIEVTTANDTLFIIPNKRYTIPITFTNTAKHTDSLKTILETPEAWSVFHDIPNNIILNKNSDKITFVLLKANSNINPGIYPLRLHYGIHGIRRIKTIYLNLAKEEKTEVSIVSFPEEIRSNEETYIKYLVKNTGNISDTLYISYTNANMEKDVEKTWILPPGEDLSVALPFSVPEQGIGKSYFMSETHFTSLHNGKKMKARKNIPVYHSTFNNKEEQLLFPVTAGIQYYNTSLPNRENNSHFQFELTGNGYLDKTKKRNIDFTFRGPNTIEQPRFGNYDQYSANYTSEKISASLGDYVLKLNMLSLQNRWVRGAKAKINLNPKTSITTFYGKPRFFTLTNKIYGATFTRTNNRDFSYFAEWLQKEEIFKNELYNGWIGTGGFDYRKEGFSINGLLSYSNADEYNGYGFQLNPQFRDGSLSAAVNYLFASNDFFGYYNDSENLNAHLHYNLFKNIRIGVGYNQAQYNKQLDDFEFNTQPLYSQVFSEVRWRFKPADYLQLRLYRRNRKDRAEDVSFDYKEYGIRSFFNWNFNGLHASLQNTFAKTTNFLLPENNNTGTSYNTRLTLSIFPFDGFSLKPYIEHLETNRFNTVSSENEIYWYYGLTAAYKTQNFSGSVFWRNSYAKDELYKDRNFFNANINYNITKRDVVTLAGGYTIFPAPLENKDLYFSIGYKHRFDISLEKNRNKYNLTGNIDFYRTLNQNKAGIRFRINEEEVVTNENGGFTVKNIKNPSVTVDIDKNTLPTGYLTLEKFPQIIALKTEGITTVSATLIRESNLTGTLSVKKAPYSKLEQPKIYLKLYNEQHKYFAEVDKKSTFRFMHIIPGTYKLEILNDLKKYQLEIGTMPNEIILLPGETIAEDIELKEIIRKVRFVKLKK